MSDVQLILLSTAIIHLSFAFSISIKDKIRLYYLYILLSLCLYNFTYFLYYLTEIDVFQKLIGTAGLFIALTSFLFFYQSTKAKINHKILILIGIIALLLAVVTVNPGIFPNSEIINGIIISDTNNFTYIYAVFIAVSILAQIIFVIKDNSKNKISNRFIFIGFITFALIASTTDLYLPLVGQENLVFIGPISSLIFSIFIYFSSFKTKDSKLNHSLIKFFALLLFFHLFSFTILSNTTPMFTKLFVTFIAIVALTDITKQNRKDISQYKNLQREYKANMEFISDVAHRLKGPLVIINTKANKAIKNKKNYQPELKGIAEISLATTNTVKNIVQNSKIDFGMATIRKQPTNLSDFLKHQLTYLESLAPDHKIIFQTEPNCHASIDRGYLLEALTNIIDNARKFSPPKSKITIQLKKDSNLLYLSIADEGSGIDKSELKKVFRRHYQGKNKTTVAGSAGLGLPLVKWVVEQHGGKILVESTIKHNNKNCGTTFSLVLPCLEKPLHKKNRLINKQVADN